MVLKVAEYVNIALWICYNCCTILFKIIWAHNKEASGVTVLRFLLFPMPAVLFFMKMSNWQRASSYIIRVHQHFSQTSLCCLESFYFFFVRVQRSTLTHHQWALTIRQADGWYIYYRNQALLMFISLDIVTSYQLQ